MSTGLRRFRSSRAETARAKAVERCEMCAEPLEAGHGHVVDLETRALVCACRGCRLLFVRRGRYRAVPDRFRYAPSFRVSPADWDELGIPVRTAFFFRNSSLGRTVAFYPSPAGATESLLPLATWERVLAANPELADAEPDVEALLVDRAPDGSFSCHLVPIDACYRLVGLVRLHWKGFDGGREAWEAIDGFFAALRRRARVLKEV
ncbi:DUF5947 family protein [Microbispora hainanensis]|jgi:hypothetical protein|uniref:DUF5947 family protein n=1 Tax=Microbispora hainanensis TaxID=568844 RepID=A0ABZ1SJG2_9ACTN|nr:MULTISPECIES: DUF5947 family protein [Microbispora]NJP29650.1 hypothetical protein [Microbispora sp. CL1-1]TQS04658.1 hypothetical protein FLW53_36750 [Microbispora sp. SCL1-1]